MDLKGIHDKGNAENYAVTKTQSLYSLLHSTVLIV
jgi:hypothetical protein